MRTRALNNFRNYVVLPCTMTLTGWSLVYAADYPSTILADKPVAYYRLEETSGTVAADSSGNQLDATYIANSTATFPELGQPGIDTNSVFFNGGSDAAHVDIPYNIVLSPTNADGKTGAPFSAECWAQATSGSLSDYTSPLAMSGAYSGAYATAGSGWNFYQTQGPNSAWALFIRGSGVNALNGPKVTLLTWYHLAVTWDGTNATLYVNGVAASTQAITYYAVDPVAAYDGSIGSGPQTGHGAFAGGVDEVAFYTNALSAAQIMNHYQVGTNSFRAVAVRPAFVQQPASTTNYSGTQVTFSTIASGTPPLTYIWKRSGNAISGATDSKYSFISKYPDDDGASISVTVTNSVGSTNSDVATLTVLTNLDVLYPPFAITRTVGSKAAFRVVAASAQPLTYQWFRGTSAGPAAILGATNDTLWLNNVQNIDQTDYHVHLVNPFTAVDSDSASLTIQSRAVSVPITGYAKVVTADDPVAYWRLNETTGSATAVDAVGSFDGAYDNSKGDITFGIPSGIPHDSDTAVDLSDTNTSGFGSGGVVSIPYALELNPHGSWSVEAWVRPDAIDPNNFRTVLSSQYNFNFSTAVYGWLIYQHPAAAFTLVLFNGSGASGFFGSDFGHIPLVPGTWYHLVLTDDGTNIQLYVNGVAGSATDTVAHSGFLPNGINGDRSASASPEVLGQRSDGAFLGFSGGMDEVAFYNYALSPSQVEAHYSATVRLNAGKAGSSTVLTWTFGTLQSAPAVGGTYTDLPNAASPYTIPAGTTDTYYRVRWQTP